MAAIEPHKLWEQNNIILRNSSGAEGISPVPQKLPHELANELNTGNEGIMYADHVNPNNLRAEQRRQEELAEIARMDADNASTVVLPAGSDEKPPTPPAGPQIVPESGAGTGNGGGAGASASQWKSNA